MTTYPVNLTHVQIELLIDTIKDTLSDYEEAYKKDGYCDYVRSSIEWKFEDEWLEEYGEDYPLEELVDKHIVEQIKALDKVLGKLYDAFNRW